MLLIRAFLRLFDVDSQFICRTVISFLIMSWNGIEAFQSIMCPHLARNQILRNVYVLCFSCLSAALHLNELSYIMKMSGLDPSLYILGKRSGWHCCGKKQPRIQVAGDVNVL